MLRLGGSRLKIAEEKFNIGISTVIRIHNLLMLCNNSSLSEGPDKFRMWNETLDDLYREVYPLVVSFFTKEKFPTLCEEVMEEDRRAIKRCIVGFYEKLSSRAGQRRGVDSGELFTLLDSFEKKIRLILHNRNMLFPKKEELQY